MENELLKIILKIGLIFFVYFFLFLLIFRILGKWFFKYYEKVMIQRKHSVPFYIIISLIAAVAVAGSNLIIDKLLK